MPDDTSIALSAHIAAVRDFFASSEALDHDVLRPLRHIRPNWEVTWDEDERRYEPEKGSFAAKLNGVIDDLAITAPPERYHENEDALAHYVVERLKWPIRKENGRWVGEDYGAILEYGSLDDIDQAELLTAAAGRIQAAIKRGQLHFDQMERSHRKMLAAVLSIILYRRSD